MANGICQLKAVLVIAVFLTWTSSLATACSAVACIDDGLEMASPFVVALEYDGHVLPGATVRITEYREGTEVVPFSGLTASDGSVRLDLPAGKYWLHAEFLGIGAAKHCFHVPARPSRKAKRRMKYVWGKFPAYVRRASGKLIDSQPGIGGTPLWNQIRRVNLPIVGSTLKLTNPSSGAVFVTRSNETGAFTFDQLPEGIYVLNVTGGRSTRDFEGTTHLVEISSKAKGEGFALIYRDAGGGSCGGTEIQLDVMN